MCFIASWLRLYMLRDYVPPCHWTDFPVLQDANTQRCSHTIALLLLMQRKSPSQGTITVITIYIHNLRRISDHLGVIPCRSSNSLTLSKATSEFPLSSQMRYISHYVCLSACQPAAGLLCLNLLLKSVEVQLGSCSPPLLL